MVIFDVDGMSCVSNETLRILYGLPEYISQYKREYARYNGGDFTSLS